MSAKTDLKNSIEHICLEEGVNPEQFPDLVERLYKVSIEYGKYQRIAGTKAFIGMAEKMRNKQKSFFNGDKSVLKEAKKLEEKFDEALEYVKKYS